MSGSVKAPDARYFVTISGVKTVDDSEVSSISLEIVQNTLTVSPTSNNGVTLDTSKNKLINNLSGKNFNMTNAIGVFFYYYPEKTVPFTGTTSITLSGTLKIKLKAYNANGDLLQESQEITVGGL